MATGEVKGDHFQTVKVGVGEELNSLNTQLLKKPILVKLYDLYKSFKCKCESVCFYFKN